MHSLLLFLNGLFLLLDLDVGFLCQGADRFDKGLVLRLFDEVYRVASFSASETLERASVGEDVKGWCLLLMEGAASDIAYARLLQLYMLGDDLHDVCAVQYGVNDFLSYHSD